MRRHRLPARPRPAGARPGAGRRDRRRDPRLDSLAAAARLERNADVARDLPAVRAEVEATGDKRLLASVLALEGGRARAEGKLDDAIGSTRAAYFLARGERDPELAARLAASLVWMVGRMKGDLASAEDWGALALAEVEHLPSTPAAIVAHQAVGALAEQRGDGPRALAHQQLAVDSAVRYFGPRHYLTADAQLNLAGALDAAGRPADAAAQYEVALPTIAEVFGPRSLRYARALSHHGSVLSDAGLHVQARAAAEQALRAGLDANAKGEDLAALYLHLGAALMNGGERDEAIKVAKLAREVATEAGLPALAAQALLNGASARVELARLGVDADHQAERAEIELTEAVRVLAASWGDDHPDVALALTWLATLHVDRGRCPAATATARRALAIYERDPQLAAASDPLILIARCELVAGKPARAVPLLERAARLRHDGDDDPVLLAEADAWLGLALLSTDAPRATTLLRGARGPLATSDGQRLLVAQVDQALAKLVDP